MSRHIFLDVHLHCPFDTALVRIWFFFFFGSVCIICIMASGQMVQIGTFAEHSTLRIGFVHVEGKRFEARKLEGFQTLCVNLSRTSFPDWYCVTRAGHWFRQSEWERLSIPGITLTPLPAAEVRYLIAHSDDPPPVVTGRAPSSGSSVRVPRETSPRTMRPESSPNLVAGRSAQYSDTAVVYVFHDIGWEFLGPNTVNFQNVQHAASLPNNLDPTNYPSQLHFVMETGVQAQRLIDPPNSQQPGTLSEHRQSDVSNTLPWADGERRRERQRRRLNTRANLQQSRALYDDKQSNTRTAQQETGASSNNNPSTANDQTMSEGGAANPSASTSVIDATNSFERDPVLTSGIPDLSDHDYTDFIKTSRKAKSMHQIRSYFQGWRDNVNDS